MAHNYTNLIIWQKGMELTDHVFYYSATLPKEERYNLIDQMNRSSCSIPSNIAEGSGKRTPLHFGEFLSTSLSSAYELENTIVNLSKTRIRKQK
jgi:four helix bundle protein